MTATEHDIDCLNGLLRGELAAIETYQQAIAKIEHAGDIAELRAIHEEHREAANSLRQQLHACGGKPDQGSGVWGAWAKLVEGTAKIFGETAALKALKEGEEQGVKDYHAAAKDDELSPESRTMIHGRLLPQTREHVTVLARLMSAQSAR